MFETQESEVPQPVPQPEPRDADLYRLDDLSVAAASADSGSHPPRRSMASEIFFGSDGLRAGWGLLIYIALFIVLSSGVISVMKHVQPHHTLPSGRSLLQPSEVLSTEGLMAAVVMFSTWIMAKIERRPIFAFGLAPTRWLPRLLAGFVWGIGFLSLLIFVLRSTGNLVFQGRLVFGSAAVRYAILWFASFFAVAFFEETFFRGYMQHTLARRFSGIYGWLGAPNRQALGFWTAALLVSFGFGFIHTSNPGESPVGLLSAGLIGVVFSLSLWRTGSLWWAIGLHASWDWAQSFLYGVADSGTLVSGRLFSTQPIGRPIFSGGLTGPEGSVLILPVLLLIVVAILVTLPRTGAAASSANALQHPLH